MRSRCFALARSGDPVHAAGFRFLRTTGWEAGATGSCGATVGASDTVGAGAAGFTLGAALADGFIVGAPGTG